MAMADVTVYGAGIFGLSIAWVCAARGARVQVIDPYGAGAGASGGIVGALAPHTPDNWNVKKQFQFESLMMMEGFWAEVEAAGGKSSGYARLGRLQSVANEADLALARTRSPSADRFWQGAAKWELLRAQDCGDWAPQSPTGWVIHDTLSGRMHPRQACVALAAALRIKGVEIVAAAAPSGQVLWATGVADLWAINAASGRSFGSGVKGQGALLGGVPGVAQAPQIFSHSVHMVPHANGTVAVGSTSEREFDDPKSIDAQLDEVIAKARAAVPILAEAKVLERWAGLRPRSRSRAPVLGAHPIHAGAYIANGGFKIGFGMAPKVAEVMADLILDGRDAIPDGFRPEASLRARSQMRFDG